MAHLLWMLPLLLFVILIYAMVFLGPSLVKYCFYIISAIPFYIMGRRCEFKHSWVAFLPLGKNYIAFTLPFNEYNLGIFKTKRRKLVYWLWFVFEIITRILSAVMYYFMIPVTAHNIAEPASEMGEFFLSDSYAITATVIFAASSFLFWAIRSIFHWRKNYDLLIAYGQDQHALWASLVNIICPLVMLIYSYILMEKDPINGGWGCYRDCFKE